MSEVPKPPGFFSEDIKPLESLKKIREDPKKWHPDEFTTFPLADCNFPSWKGIWLHIFTLLRVSFSTKNIWKILFYCVFYLLPPSQLGNLLILRFPLKHWLNIHYLLAVFLPWYEAPSVSQLSASATLWVFRDPMCGAEDDGPVIWTCASFHKALTSALASKSLHCLNPHTSRGRWTVLFLLSLTHSKVDQHPGQITTISCHSLDVCCFWVAFLN